MDSYIKFMMKDEPIPCAVNPRTSHEDEYPACGVQDGNNRLVLVVGAGPSGLMAARELRKRGFRVKVLEKEAVPGGQINLADKPPYKDRLDWCIEDLLAQDDKLGVEFDYGVTATTPILRGELQPKNRNLVLVGSGMTGLETAEMLIQNGNHITIVEMAERIAPGYFGTDLVEKMRMLDAAGTKILLGKKLEKIGDHSVTISLSAMHRKSAAFWKPPGAAISQQEI